MVELGEVLACCGAWSLPTLLLAMQAVSVSCARDGPASAGGGDDQAGVGMDELLLDAWLRALRSSVMRCVSARARAGPTDLSEAAALLLWMWTRMRMPQRSALSATAFVHVLASVLSLRERVVCLEMPRDADQKLALFLFDELVCHLGNSADPCVPHRSDA
jgi:hypothetical protein